MWELKISSSICGESCSEYKELTKCYEAEKHISHTFFPPKARVRHFVCDNYIEWSGEMLLVSEFRSAINAL